jgi:hypothetical protein
LGLVLLNSDRYLASVRAALDPSDFSLDTHIKIYRRIVGLADQGKRVERMVLAEELMQRGELEGIGGLSYLVSLDDGMPEFPNADEYIRIVKQKSDLRRLALTGNVLVNSALQETADPAIIAAGVRQDLDAMRPATDEAEPDAPEGNIEFPEIAWRGLFAKYRDVMQGTTEACDAAHFATLWASVAAIMGR